ncbi:MAG: terminase large subunit [Lachnospiraceae bacterium]|nr:terminase large subunit [Lachnospiraceae bacterium]
MILKYMGVDVDKMLDNLEDYNYETNFDIEDLRGGVCMGAVDLSQTTDLACAKVLLMKPGDNHKYIYTRYFIPELKLDKVKNDKNAGANYLEWSQKGLIQVCEGNDIALSEVADWFRWLYENYNIKLWKCGYDQKFSKEWINRMNYHGWTKEDEELIMILQNAQTLSNAMKLCEADLKNKLVIYGNNDVDKWCLGNAGIKVDINEMCLCVKREPNKRIDGAVTLIILYEMYRRYRTEFKQIIENGDSK